jgi:DNA-directed RNA polymerase subunit beta'
MTISITKEIIFALQCELFKLESFHASFDFLQISIASPRRIKSWSQRRLPNGEFTGQVRTGETVNFRTHKPEFSGLFCERIFGPSKDWKCYCLEYNGLGVTKICEHCSVEIIEARVRRYRMGYIELTSPIAHIWYFKGVPNYLMILLRCYDSREESYSSDPKSTRKGKTVRVKKLKYDHLDEIIYSRNGLQPFSDGNHLAESFAKYDPYSNELKPILSQKFININKRLGSEIIKVALDKINLEEEVQNIRKSANIISLGDLKKKNSIDKGMLRQVRIFESFLSTQTQPGWLVLTTLPVLPPTLRPLIELKNGKLVAADVNELYRLIVTRNQRLFDLIYRNTAPLIVNIHGQKLVQEAIDALIDNARLPKNKIIRLNDKPLKSLTEILEGKQGRFRQTLLGKRVDYSGRSVIIVNPHLRLNECGLPYHMGIELFQPFLIHQILKTIINSSSQNIRLATFFIRRNKPFVWSLLVKLMRNYCILLNRAPTLHRFGIQAFDPIIILGQAIHLHPLVCTGFNADFDGDQMAVHLPLYEASQLEARTMMRPSYNVLSPANGEAILKPTQDMVIGCYYLTMMFKQNNAYKITPSFDQWFPNEEEAILAFSQKKIGIHTPILVRYKLISIPIKIKNNKIEFSEEFSIFMDFNHKEITIFESFSKDKIRHYLITNLGILIIEKKNNKSYYLTNFFIETTAGRLIFTKNFNNIIKQ